MLVCDLRLVRPQLWPLVAEGCDHCLKGPEDAVKGQGEGEDDNVADVGGVDVDMFTCPEPGL